ncbi:hypothetical protein [Chryseobacterium sp.]|jgi:hypothetical protein|uniref:hypothetical protein n=1 Tax=Chryseobacterium sp. TaxID=1871047 RepID=UPI0025BA55AF|nr:hypothetical protein [Chryseobacterium sp.]
MKSEQQKITILTGKKCTVSGEWEIEDRVTTTIYVSKGELMPSYCGVNVKWVLVTKG